MKQYMQLSMRLICIKLKNTLLTKILQVVADKHASYHYLLKSTSSAICTELYTG